ncbi:hypothetical protein ABT369_48230 [Dactylosporangium sp. NPDC000244]|uniref:hypothetical protein n=1 Tax=Dactylosporangium sp. NPDC000244 TaxID=3154365 RepID=UPI00332E8134
MDRFEGRAWLEWWANPSTVLGVAEIDLVVTAGDGWDARGRLVTTTAEDREGFAFLCEMDPVFELRFADESQLTVEVRDLRDDGRFELVEYDWPPERPITVSGRDDDGELAAAP